MILKSFSAVVTSVALSGAVLAASIVPGTACPFKQTLNSGNTVTFSSPASPTDSSLNFNRADAGKFGLAGVALLGLFAGGMVLKSRWMKQPEVAPELAQADYKELPSFPIEVPAEALPPRTDAAKAGAER